ncbi:hypothetical protein [Arenibaculum pallidiluteum]|uniref:hypothetical protein n=1 Tax=Arenibaculum pallidiluteum TaxID=2812559 RepID=UPI001A9605BB|nr:hypothetical protein [Arenibaculum pallidiluteum]
MAGETAMFRRYKVHFTRRSDPPARRRPERDVNAELLRTFVSRNGLVGELDRILPSAAFGILEISCTPLLADRLTEMSEVEVVLES